ncbi:hypothetical protein [Bradyrhizobium sp. 41S5]|nr:hypothetical protein [Bradyrhizobium sp. 41S5]
MTSETADAAGAALDATEHPDNTNAAATALGCNLIPVIALPF